MKMYYDDFDANGSFETIVATEKEGSYYPIGMDDLAEQFSGMIKRNLNPIRHSRGKPWKRYLVHRCFQMQNHLKFTI
jgi:hypothetical protein